MPAYRTIVVGTDGSDTSLAAVDRAAEVAADRGGRADRPHHLTGGGPCHALLGRWGKDGQVP